MYFLRPTVNPSRKVNYYHYLIGILLAIVLATASAFHLSPFIQLDNLVYDTYLQWKGSKQVSDQVVVVDIDDISLSEVGQWPWPRYRVANLVQLLSDMGPKVIALDIIFPEEDRTALKTIKQNFKNDFGLDLQFTGVPDQLANNDGFLGHVLAKTDAIGANYFYFDHAGTTGNCNDVTTFITGSIDLLELHSATALLCNNMAVSSQLKSRGFINSQLDEDGNLRRLPLLIQYDNKIYPNLSLAALQKVTGSQEVQVVSTGYGVALELDDLTIPIQKDGFALLPYNGPARTHLTFTALDFFNGSVEKGKIENKIVFVGSSAAGLNDLYNTVFDSRYPGVEAHALLVGSVLSGQHIIIPEWSNLLLFVLCLVVGIIVPALFMVTSGPFLQIGCTCFLLVLIVATSLLGFFEKGIFISPVSPLLLTLTLFGFVSCFRYATEKKLAYDWYRKLAQTQQLTLESMASVAETRDPETGDHIKRTQYYVRALAMYLFRCGFYATNLTPEYIDLLFISAPLHDIGKVRVPDNILLKPARLTFDEFEEMKKHAEYGQKIILSTAQKMEDAHFLKVASDIAVYHHEKWDGTGYPKGISGETIPLCGRLMAVADVYDALISKRCYKSEIPHDQAMEIMMAGKGTQFDPLIIDAFFSIEEQIKDISVEFKDNGIILPPRPDIVD